MKGLGLNLSDAQFEALHHDCDTDGDGKLTLKEFVDSCKRARVQMDAKKAAMKSAISTSTVPKDKALALRRKVEAAKGKK